MRSLFDKVTGALLMRSGDPYEREARSVLGFVGGHVLEIGYGLGVMHGLLHNTPAVRGITVCDNRAEALDQCRCACAQIQSSWADAEFTHGFYSTIVFDTGFEVFPLRDVAKLRHALSGPRARLLYYRYGARRFDVYTREALSEIADG